MDQAGDPGVERLLGNHAGPADVDIEHPLTRAVAHRGRAGDVKDPLDALHRPADRAPVGDVPGGAIELDSLQMAEVGGAACEQPQVVAALRQGPHQVRPEEARAAGHERRRHTGLIL